MQNIQLVNDLSTLANISFVELKIDSTFTKDILSKDITVLQKRNKIIILSTLDYNYLVLKKETYYICGPFEKDNLIILDYAKLLYFTIFNKTYKKNEIKTLTLDVIIEDTLFLKGKTVKDSVEINIIDFLEESVKTADIESIKSYIKIMLNSLVTNKDGLDSFRLQKNLIIYIFSYIFSTIDNNNIDPDFNIFLTSIITSEFEFCDNSSQLLFKVYQLIDKISDSFDFSSKKSNNKIREAQYYINNNLEKKLTLDKVAKEMGISAKFLSSLFVEVTNTTFKEYVNRQRIDKARNLLAYSTTSISEISNQIGITSPNNFISFFKKYTQTTPNNFREQLKTD
jgi:YesN/AraC family two-component response regulator